MSKKQNTEEDNRLYNNYRYAQLDTCTYTTYNHCQMLSIKLMIHNYMYNVTTGRA